MKKLIPVFTIFKEGTTLNGPVTIMKEDGDENYNVASKTERYKSMGYTVALVSNKTNQNLIP